jgi:FMN phosphatase YigB (HAD superfamily)
LDGDNIRVCWIGFDWGETLVDPREGYQYTKKLITAILKKIGKSEETISEKLRLFDELVERSPYEAELMDGIESEREFWMRHFKFKHLMDVDVHKIYSHIFDNDQSAIRLYERRRFGFFKLAEGLKPCLRHIKSKGISINLVSEVGSEKFLEYLPTILSSRGLLSYFTDIITNKGAVRADGSLDSTYKGRDKISGSLYEKLREDLLNCGIQPSQAAIIGDRPLQDVEVPRKYGFKAIQYVGIVKRRISNLANYVISDLRELIKIIDPDLDVAT